MLTLSKGLLYKTTHSNKALYYRNDQNSKQANGTWDPSVIRLGTALANALSSFALLEIENIVLFHFLLLEYWMYLMNIIELFISSHQYHDIINIIKSLLLLDFQQENLFR